MELTQPITCTADNVTEFNAALREHLSEARPLIKALMERGMVEGLRGCAIGPLGALPAGVEPVLSMDAEKRIQEAKSKRGEAK